MAKIVIHPSCYHTAVVVRGGAPAVVVRGDAPAVVVLLHVTGYIAWRNKNTNILM